MTYAFVALLGAAIVWLAQGIFKWWYGDRSQLHERLITLSDSRKYAFIQFDAPEGWDPHLKITGGDWPGAE